jgi:hypothetical protein
MKATYETNSLMAILKAHDNATDLYDHTNPADGLLHSNGQAWHLVENDQRLEMPELAKFGIIGYTVEYQQIKTFPAHHGYASTTWNVVGFRFFLDNADDIVGSDKFTRSHPGPSKLNPGEPDTEPLYELFLPVDFDLSQWATQAEFVNGEFGSDIFHANFGK